MAPVALDADVLIAFLDASDAQHETAVDAFIDAIGATIVPLDRIIARRAARLRASHRALRLPDAIALATALVAGAEHVTLDRRLGTIAEIERTAG